MTTVALPAVPKEPVATTYTAEVYQAFTRLIQSPEINGIGANAGDPEILRLACLEKVRRHGPDAAHDRESDFRLNFLGYPRFSWAENRGEYWDEGLGYDWNCLVFAPHPAVLLSATLFHGTRPFIFSFHKLPARLPEADCEIHEHYSICYRNASAPKLTEAEKTIWNDIGRAAYGPNHQFEWSVLDYQQGGAK